MNSIIIGAESDLGLHIDGTRLGPRTLINELNSKVKTIYLNPNNPKDNLHPLKNKKAINKFNTKLYNTIFQNKDYFPITIGGDHSISIATCLAQQKIKENIGVIWFDAHPDFNTFNTTVTGNIHGLPLACIAGYENEELRLFHQAKPVNPQNIVVVGARSIDKLEQENLTNANIKVFTTNDIKKRGLKNVLNEALEIAGNNTNSIHVSYDLDVIDPRIAPGVSVPEVLGINSDEALEALEILLNNKKVLSFDLVEYNPLKDQNDKTLKLALTLLTKALNIIDTK